MPISVQEQIFYVFNYIKSNSQGISREEVEHYIDSSQEFFWTNFISIDEFLESSLVIGRLKVNGNRYIMTEKGKEYVSNLALTI